MEVGVEISTKNIIPVFLNLYMGYGMFIRQLVPGIWGYECYTNYKVNLKKKNLIIKYSFEQE